MRSSSHSNDRPLAGLCGRRQLPRPHCRRRRGHLGGSTEVVQLPTHALRCQFHSPRQHRRDSGFVTKDTASVIVEPVQGLAGAVDLGREFLQALRKRCDEVGALLIFDEVQCGMGRVGQPFAANLYDVTPRHDHDGQGVGKRHSLRRAADHCESHLSIQTRPAGYDVRRWSDGLRGD